MTIREWRTSGDAIWSARMHGVLRIVAALLFFEHGVQKVFGFPPPAGPAPAFTLASQLGVAGVLETVGGTLLLLGLFTRPVAFLLAGEMAVAYFQVHFPRSIYPIVNRGESAVLFCFIFLYFMVAGGGAWSLDAMLARRRTRSVDADVADDAAYRERYQPAG